MARGASRRIADAIRAGRIDCGTTPRSVAKSAGLDFLPLAWERFDLVLRQRDYFMKGPQAVLRDRAAELGGYDVKAGELGRGFV